MTADHIETDTLIVGGGLSGLALAEGFERLGTEYHLVEARDRIGGRILTYANGSARFDMGPAWFWPGQPRMAALVDRLGLSRFDQASAGDALFENELGQIQRGRGMASMEGSWRLDQGMSALTNALNLRLSGARVHLSAKVTQIRRTDQGVAASLANGGSFHAARIILALPPRLAATISFKPPLPDATQTAMQNVPTWMAGQAKVVAVYDRAVWRDAGLSGDAFSRLGPMVELHDASPANGGPFAVFGFVGLPPDARMDKGTLKQKSLRQLERLFGPKAAQPKHIFIKDWALDQFTATISDHEPMFSHPTYGMPCRLNNLWDNQLVFAGTEVAPQFGGYLEGALEAADNTLDTFAL